MPRLSLATDTGVLRATGGHGDGWRGHWTEPGGYLECLAAVGDRTIVGSADGVCYGSAGVEADWQVLAERGDRVTALTVDPHDPETVWLGTEPSRVYRSEGGGTWTERPGLADLPSADRWSFPPRPHTHHVRWIAVDPGDPGHLAVAVEAGAFLRSRDGGETWLDHAESARRDTHTIATHPEAPGRLYVAAGDGYAESPDWGDSWVIPQDGLDHRYVWSVAVAPTDPDDVFVSAASGPRAAHDPDGESLVYRRRDGGWDPAMDGLPGPDGLGRAVLASGPERVYAATNHGPFVRESGRWERLPVEWPERRRDELSRGLSIVG